MAKDDILVISILNDDKQYDKEQFKQKMYAESNEHVVQKLFKIIERHIVPDCRLKIVNKSHFFERIEYYLRLFLDCVDPNIYKESVSNILNKIKGETRYSSYDREFVINPIKGLLIRLKEKFEIPNILSDFNDIEAIRRIIRDVRYINFRNSEDLHLIVIAIKKYIDVFNSSPNNKERLIDYEYIIRWIFAQESLFLLPKDKANIKLLLQNPLLPIANADLFIKKIKKYWLEGLVINNILNNENPEIIMSDLGMNHYEELLDFLFELLEEKIDEMKAKTNAQQIELIEKVIRACLVVRKVYSKFEEKYVEAVLEKLKSLKANILDKINSITEQRGKEKGRFLETLKLLLLLEQKFENVMIRREVARKNTADEKIQQQIRELKQSELTLSQLEIPRFYDIMNIIIKRLALEYGVHLNNNDMLLEEIPQIDYKDRVDFTSQRVITIDDLDTVIKEDAFYLESDLRGFYNLYIHIPHPNALLRNRPDLKEEAVYRVHDLHVADLNVSMLPPIVGRKYGSLHWGLIRNVLTHKFEITRDGEILSYRCVKGIIRVNDSLTYGEADSILNKGHDDRQLEILLNRMLETALLIKSRMNGSKKIEKHNYQSKTALRSSHNIVDVFNFLVSQEMIKFFDVHKYPAIYVVRKESEDGLLLSKPRYDYVNNGHVGLKSNIYTYASRPLSEACSFLMQGELAEAFLIPEHPTDKDYYYYQEYVKRVVDLLNERSLINKMFLSDCGREYRQQLIKLRSGNR